MRELTAAETGLLAPLFESLACHHNGVSEHFSGRFPTHPVERQLEECRSDLESGKTRVAVIENGEGSVIACCKIDIVDGRGYLDELVVMPEHRSKGLGTQLIAWADDVFRQTGVTECELMVVVGNNRVQRFYERHGYLPALTVMRRYA